MSLAAQGAAGTVSISVALKVFVRMATYWWLLISCFSLLNSWFFFVLSEMLSFLVDIGSVWRSYWTTCLMMFVDCWFNFSIFWLWMLWKFGLFLFVLGAKIPLYAFKKLNKISGSKGLCCEYENSVPPVAFLDSLLLGEVCSMICFGYQLCLSFNVYNGFSSCCSGRTGCSGGFFAMMSLLVKLRL